MKPWNELPVAEQVKRMRGVLATVLPRWGLGKAELRFIFHGENTTFRARTKRGDFLIRVARPGYHTPEETLSELAWLESLHAETGLCPQPVRDSDGEFIAVLDANDVYASHVCVFRWTDGVIVGRRTGRKTLIETGELIGRFHNHSAAFKPLKKLQRPSWQRMTGTDPEPEAATSWKLLPAEHRRQFRAIQRWALPTYASIAHRRDIGLIHADLHSHNLLRTPNGLAAIDFDDCGFAPWVMDFAVAGAYWNKDQPDRLAWMLEGYQRQREVSMHQLQHLHLLIAWRLAGVCLWVTARAQENETFRPRLLKIQDNLLRQARGALERDYIK